MIKEGKRPFRKAVFIVTYRKTKDSQIEYLLLKRKLHWTGWEFPKGGVDKGERLQETAKRECFEESGLKPLKLMKYPITGKYKYHKPLADRPGIIGQTYTLFSAQVSQERVTLDKKEHAGYVWLSFQKAIKKLTHENQKKCLKIVNRGLENKK